MKKWLLFIAIVMLSQANNLCAQSLFYAPDTVCVHQQVKLSSYVFNQQSYYWGFCSGYLNNYPTGVNLGKTYDLKIPANIDIAYDSGYYYGFVVNAGTNEFLCYFFGTSLNNRPTITNLGNVLGGLPVNPSSLFILKDTFSHHWYIYVSGGYTRATSSLARLDFGPHLYNTRPNIVNFGNYNGALNYPKGVFVAQDKDNNWYGYVVNFNNSHLIRLDFSFNESNTPLMTDLGIPLDSKGNATLNYPTDLAAMLYHGNWYMYITNWGNTGESGNGSVSMIALGDSLAPSKFFDTALGNFSFRIDSPSSIVLNQDCGEMHAYITDSTTSQLIGIEMPDPTNPLTYHAIDYSVLGGMKYPSCISSILRDSNNLYGFIVNSGDSSLTRVDFVQCNNSSIPSYTEVAPPVYTYDEAGLYNVYFVVNQGLPTMQVDCKQIRVLDYPPININPTTSICLGDSLRLYAVSTLADSIRWFSGYNIDTSYIYRDSVRVWPEISYTYPVTLYYPFGCIVDTSVTIDVTRVVADAGPDRWILDGATTTLGGPYTSVGNYTYHWGPFYNLSDSTVRNPFAIPYVNYTYYLTVSGPKNTTELNDTSRCYASDTVNVFVNCGDFYLPNAFSPNSGDPATAYFGILNNNIIQLNYFRIYNRWGTEVFQTDNITLKWDGTFNGKPAEEGVYIWMASGFCGSGKAVKKQGNVTLMR